MHGRTIDETLIRVKAKNSLACKGFICPCGLARVQLARVWACCMRPTVSLRAGGHHDNPNVAAPT